MRMILKRESPLEEPDILKLLQTLIKTKGDRSGG